MERKAKAVLRSPNFRDFTGLITEGSTLARDLNEIIDCIAAGRTLPRRFYRAGIDRDADELLEDRGVMHLHLGGPDSDELLFLVQYPERVVLLEINSHKHFMTEPKGSLLDSLHERHLVRMAAEVAKDASSEAARVDARLAGAINRLKSTPRKSEP